MSRIRPTNEQSPDALRSLRAQVVELERALANSRQSERNLRMAHDSKLAKTEAALKRKLAQRMEVEEKRHDHLLQLAHVQRIATLGEIAAGLAHEINQPLSAIANYAQGCINRLQSDQGDPQEICGTLGEVVKQAQRAGEIVRRVRGYARKDWLQPSVANINAVVSESVAFMQSEAKKSGVRIHQRLDGRIGEIKADPIQIEQVLLNLILNSIDAMKNQETPRTITIETTMRNHGEHIEVTVTDTGAGLPEESGRIFDTFFTTKPRGLGMGLSISRNIIEAHGGQITAQPHPTRGTVIQFVLPDRRE